MTGLVAGARLGPYEVLSPLGSGGMGEVYRARDTRLNREVAIKVLPGAFANDPARLKRFEKEALAVGQLNHPNVLTLHDVGTHEGAPFVVSELLDGVTLRTQIQAGELETARAVDYAVQMAEGLAAAHEKGIVHRDLKPENVVVTRGDRLKILDFGLAKLTGSEAADDTGELEGTGPLLAGPDLLTGPGLVIGTLGYMSPEQLRGQPVDHRSDLFSFGVVLYEMLTGRRPFQGATPVDTATAILKDDPPRLAEWRGGIPGDLEAIIRRCLEKNPARRFSSAREVLDSLRAARQARPLHRRLRRVLLWSLPVGVVAAVVFIGTGQLRDRLGGRLPPPPSIHSMAVLPFKELSGSPEQEYFADGMTDALIGSLGSIQGLRVISRTSVMHYKDEPKPLPVIARELGVDALAAACACRSSCWPRTRSARSGATSTSRTSRTCSACTASWPRPSPARSGSP
jgi:serine/threonine protein kinase